MLQPSVICLMGPTACGKTKIAIELLRHLPCEIISVDSAMVYKTMDIGTAKPTQAELALAPHHLIDIKDPSEAFSAAEFQSHAMSLIETIHRKGKIPLLVGGTMLYFRALQQGLSPLPSAHPIIRARLLEEAGQVGWAAMHAQLKCVDPKSASRICVTDTQRIQRALEVYEVTGQSITDLWQNHTKDPLPYQVINLAIAVDDRSLLHERIEQRFYAMIQAGFLGEVERLYKRGDLHSNLPAIRSVGYRQAWEHLEGKIDEAEMCDRGIVATRQLAKRQMTWLRHWGELTWFDSEDQHIVKKILHYLSSFCTNL